MAQPNILNLTVGRANTALQNVTNVVTNFLSNANASNKVVRVESILASNRQNTVTDLSIEFVRGTLYYPIAANVAVPDKSTLYLLDKSSYIYLQEGDYLQCFSSTNNYINLIITYEEIS
jgi:hypothetical protein